jgi:hypothetical protein
LERAIGHAVDRENGTIADAGGRRQLLEGALAGPNRAAPAGSSSPNAAGFSVGSRPSAWTIGA